MLEVVKLKNPFDKTKREIEQIKFVPGNVLTDYITDAEIEFVLNGNFVEVPNLTYPADGDQIIVMAHVGGGSLKSIIGMVASMWLMGFAGKIITGTAGGITSIVGKGTLSAYLAAGAVMYVGGKIINAVVPNNTAKAASETSTSQTYGWSTPSIVTGEGGVVGMTYGECIPAPQVLERHVETINDKQYLNLLLCGGMGPIDAISDIKIGSTSIANYTDVQMETRLGTNDQEPISFFTDTPMDQAVGLEVTETGLTQTSDSTIATSLEVVVEFTSGLYFVNDDGSYGNETIEIGVYYRKTGDTAWLTGNSSVASSTIADATCYPSAPPQTWSITVTGMNSYSVTGSVSGRTADAVAGTPYDNGFIKFMPAIIRHNAFLRKQTYTIVVSSSAFIITAAQSSALRKSTRINGLEAGQYDVKLIMVSRKTGSRHCNICTWSMLTAISPGTYARPGKVLVGLRMLATNQLSSGIPDVTWRQTRNTVNVWNPETSKYETRSARNPIWAAYDVYHQCQYIKNINTGLMEYHVFGVDQSRLSACWDEWVDAAAYSDSQVTGSDKSTLENRFEFDFFYDTELKRYAAAQKAATVGHSVIMPRGNNIGIICDKPGNMVQVFGEGRTTMSSVSGKFSAIADRASSIDVIYSDSDNDFKNTPFQVRSPAWSTDNEADESPASLTLEGVKRKSQAYREGMYALANNLLVTQFIDLNTNIDALVCSYGDIVGYAHAVSQIGIVNGRILNATANTVQFDKTVSVTADKTYQVILQLSDDTIVTKNIVPVGDRTTDTFTVATPFEAVPQQFDTYFFGETDKVVKKFRIVGITKEGDLNCKLSLAEYSEGVYSGDLNYPIVDYTPPDSKLVEVEKLQLSEENYRRKDGINVSLLHVNWNLTKNYADEFIIYASQDGNKWDMIAKTMDMSYTINSITPLKTYWVKVVVFASGLHSQGVSASLYVTGKDTPPSDVTGLVATIDPNDHTKIILDWTAVTDIDLKGYRVLVNNNAVYILMTNHYVYTAAQTGLYSFAVYAVDNSGNQSNIAATVQFNMIVEPNDVTEFKVVQKDTDRSYAVMKWNAADNAVKYEIRIGSDIDWDTATVVAQLNATSFEYKMLTEGTKYFMIKAVSSNGYYSVHENTVVKSIVLRPDTPGNFKIMQNTLDRSSFVFSWDASPGLDIAGYNVYVNRVLIQQVKGLETNWTVKVSGTYLLSISAVTVAGWESGFSNITKTIMIEPYDVENFKGGQSITTRSTVHLLWDAPLSGDVNHYEIHEGSSWENSIVIAQYVTGISCDVSISEERTYNYWIKAISNAGYYSLYPANFQCIFDLNPAPVSDVVLTQDENDKSLININWTGITEIDLLYYEIRYGWTWETAKTLVTTTNTNYQFRPDDTTGNVKILIKAVNKAKFYSDEASGTLYALLEPQDVENFIVQQNGEYVELYWDKAYEHDVTGYEIREGYTFEYGAIIVTNITGNSYKYKVAFEGWYHYHIKAVNRSNKYSVNATSEYIDIVDLPEKNIVQAFDEIETKDGIADNTEFAQSEINWQTIGGKWSDYPTLEFDEVGGLNVLRLLKQVDGTYPAAGVYSCKQIDVGKVITANISIKFLSTVKYRGDTSAIVQMRTSLDGITWTIWKDFLPSLFKFQYVETRVNFVTSDPKQTPEVNTFKIYIDLPDVEKAGTITVPIGGIRISYDREFYIDPVVTPYAIGEKIHVEITNRDKTGFHAQIYNLQNIDVGGTMDWRARGY